MIDVTMTAMMRPKLIKKTLASFRRRLLTNPSKLRWIINIDRVGDASLDETIRVFDCLGNNKVINSPKKPSFPNAVMWCWSQVSSEYCFHLEDNWTIERVVGVDAMIGTLKDANTVSSLRLSKIHIPKTKKPVMFGRFWKYKGGYFTTYAKDMFGLNPILIKTKFLQDVLPNMDDKMNPEKQIRPDNPCMMDVLGKWVHGMWGEPGDKPLVVDRGRKWMRVNGFEKPSVDFTAWRKTDESN